MKDQKPIGQGHGVAGRYAGLPDKYCDEASSKIVILPVPFDKTTTYQKGSDKGPEAMIEASRNMELYDIETGFEVYTMGIHTDRPVSEKTSEAMLDATYRRTKEWISRDKFVVVIGGEHSISFATIKAFAEQYKKLTVLQLDAHTDLQQAYENNLWSHASVMARVKELPQVKIVSVGIRSMSAEELPFLDQKHTYFAHTLLEDDAWIDQVINAISGPVYITLDLDVFDSSIMPSTGTPEPGGLDWRQATKLLKHLIKEKEVVGCDVVELCPRSSNPAPDYLAAKLVYKILSYKFSSEKEKK
jgi:agmatinase